MENKDIDNWAKESLPILKRYGYINDNKWVYISIVAIFIFSVAIGIFISQVQAGKLDSFYNSSCINNNTNSNVCNVNIPQCPMCVCNQTTLCTINYNNINLTNYTL